MKKLLSLLMLFAFITSAGMAQVPAKSTTGSVSSGKMAKKSSVMMKKDGTPDKRYKMNKTEKTAPAGPMKKDGTPDKRYKSNKMAAPKM